MISHLDLNYSFIKQLTVAFCYPNLIPCVLLRRVRTPLRTCTQVLSRFVALFSFQGSLLFSA